MFSFYFESFFCCEFWILQNKVHKLCSLAKVANGMSDNLKGKSKFCCAGEQRQPSYATNKTNKEAWNQAFNEKWASFLEGWAVTLKSVPAKVLGTKTGSASQAGTVSLGVVSWWLTDGLVPGESRPAGNTVPSHSSGYCCGSYPCIGCEVALVVLVCSICVFLPVFSASYWLRREEWVSFLPDESVGCRVGWHTVNSKRDSWHSICLYMCVYVSPRTCWVSSLFTYCPDFL